MSSERGRRIRCPPPHFAVATARPTTPSRRSASARAAGRRSIRSTTAASWPGRSRRESIAAGPPSLWRYAPLLPVEPPAEQRLAPGLTPLVRAPRLAEALGPRRAVPQARHRQPDALVQGPGRRGRGRQGAGARPHDARLLLDRQPRQRRRRARGRGGARGGRLLPGRPRAGEADLDRRLRRDAVRGRRHLRRLQPADDRAVVRAAVGVRQRRAAQLLRGGLEDARVRDRRAARLGAARRRRRADRLRARCTPSSTRASPTCSSSGWSRARRRGSSAARPRAARRSRRRSRRTRR